MVARLHQTARKLRLELMERKGTGRRWAERRWIEFCGGRKAAGKSETCVRYDHIFV